MAELTILALRSLHLHLLENAQMDAEQSAVEREVQQLERVKADLERDRNLLKEEHVRLKEDEAMLEQVERELREQKLALDLARQRLTGTGQFGMTRALDLARQRLIGNGQSGTPSTAVLGADAGHLDSAAGGRSKVLAESSSAAVSSPCLTGCSTCGGGTRETCDSARIEAGSSSAVGGPCLVGGGPGSADSGSQVSGSGRSPLCCSNVESGEGSSCAALLSIEGSHLGKGTGLTSAPHQLMPSPDSVLPSGSSALPLEEGDDEEPFSLESPTSQDVEPSGRGEAPTTPALVGGGPKLSGVAALTSELSGIETSRVNDERWGVQNMVLAAEGGPELTAQLNKILQQEGAVVRLIRRAISQHRAVLARCDRASQLYDSLLAQRDVVTAQYNKVLLLKRHIIDEMKAFKAERDRLFMV